MLRNPNFKILSTFTGTRSVHNLKYILFTYVVDIQHKTDVIDLADHNVSEQTDGAFKNIMDENGILWEDDMATLPDVSDSEFDRVGTIHRRKLS